MPMPCSRQTRVLLLLLLLGVRNGASTTGSHVLKNRFQISHIRRNGASTAGSHVLKNRFQIPHIRGGDTLSVSPPLTLAQRLIAGGVSRSFAQLVMYPADALRTLAQTRSGSRTLRELGARTLVSGCVTTSGFAMVVGAIQFAIYGVLAPRANAFNAAVVAGLGSCVASVPQEVIKQRLVTGIYPNFGAAVSTIARNEGIRGFYTGWLPTVSRNVPFVCITFTSFAALQRRTLKCRGSEERAGILTLTENLRVGISAALIAGLVTQPFDVVKTRMMTQAASGAVPYAGVADCVLTMARTEGIGAFFKGLPQRSAYMGPLWAIQFTLNGALTERLRLMNQRAALFGE